VYAENEDALTKRLQAVRKRLQEKRVTINEEKSVSLSDEITFLGFRVSAKGITPDEKLVEKVRLLKTPVSKKEVEQFVGLVNFFGRLIPNFSEKIRPLNALRKNDTPFLWTSECTECFETLKRELSNRPVIQPYCLEKDAVLATDASASTIAAVLMQEGHPVLFASRTLNAAERNYSNIEREALAIAWAVTRLKQFLLGRKFLVQTDHQPLLSMFGGKSALPVWRQTGLSWKTVS
jgi:hypothetical protein